MQRRAKLPPPEEVLTAIVALADDGYVRRSALGQRFPQLGERDLRRAVRRVVTLGLAIERRGPDGAFHVALSSEGWNRLRNG